MVDKELIEIWRNELKPAISLLLLNINYEEMGEQDKEEFERDFDEILDLALIGLKYKAQLSQEGTTKGTTFSCSHENDTISRQAAIDALDFEIVHMTAYCDGKNEGNPLAQYNKGLEDGKKAIEALPSAQPGLKWIPCSERLPDNRVDVLICYRVWQQYAKRYVYAIVNGWYARKYSVNENVFSEWEADCDYKEDEDEFYIQEGWYEFTTQGNGDLMNWYIGGAEVVAWMPMPEPYKGEAERRTDD